MAATNEIILDANEAKRLKASLAWAADTPGGTHAPGVVSASDLEGRLDLALNFHTSVIRLGNR